jgi:ribosome-associated protein
MLSGIFPFAAGRATSSRMSIDEKIVVSAEAEIGPEDMSESFIRSSGPGGQNVNKVATAVQLRFDAAQAAGLSERVRARVLRLAGQRATKDGVIVIEAGRFRTQEQNRADARARLVALIAKAAEPPPPPRKKTRPSKGAVERRLKTKAGRSTVKKLRGRVDSE